jgi:hypothetical protein
MDAPSITIEFPQKRSRLTTFFRFLLAIPLFIFAYFYEILALIAAIVAWFALVFTARYPASLYRFTSGYVRFYMRLVSYAFIVVDKYPPFSGGEYPDYPVQIAIPERKERYSRLKAFFRLIYILPILILLYVLMLVFCVLDVLAWLCALIAGRVPGFIENYMRFTLGWLLKYEALFLLLTENY